jgi:hypothetical protein
MMRRRRRRRRIEDDDGNDAGVSHASLIHRQTFSVPLRINHQKKTHALSAGHITNSKSDNGMHLSVAKSIRRHVL